MCIQFGPIKIYTIIIRTEKVTTVYIEKNNIKQTILRKLNRPLIENSQTSYHNEKIKFWICHVYHSTYN